MESCRHTCMLQLTVFCELKQTNPKSGVWIIMQVHGNTLICSVDELKRWEHWTETPINFQSYGDFSPCYSGRWLRKTVQQPYSTSAW